MQRIFLGLIVTFVAFILLVFLINLPSLYLEQGLPLFPALLAAQAAAVGIALCLYGIYLVFVVAVRNRRRLRQQTSKASNKPWMDNPQWARKRIRHSKAGKVILMWVFVANWWGAIWFFALDKGSDLWTQSLPVALLCVVFVMIGVIMLWSVIRNSISWKRFGQSFLIIETLPGRPGQRFKGHIEIGFQPKPRSPIKLTLIGFVRHWTRRPSTEVGQRTHDTYDEAPFHEAQHSVKKSSLLEVDGRCQVPLSFELPNDGRSSGAIDDETEVIWKVVMTAKTIKGADYHSEFLIPVFSSKPVLN